MSASEVPEPPLRPRNWLRRMRWPLMIAVVAVAVLIGIVAYLTGGRYQSTDDSAVASGRVSISSSISGRVMEIDVGENQAVRAGQRLFRLDDQSLQAAAAQADANLAAARLQVEGMKATYQQRLADVSEAESMLAYAGTEARREALLVAAGTGTQAKADQAKSQVEQVRQKVAAAKQAAQAALAGLGGNPNLDPARHPMVMLAAAQVTRARLDVSYVDIIAPQDGVVTKVHQLQVGDYVTASVPVFSLVPNGVWVDANFKENQIEYMRPGQPATVKLDTYPGRKFKAVVSSITPGTGASFSLLPPENATGNWVKVTQRVPVRIDFAEEPSLPMQPGLSATVSVDTGHRRRLFGSESGR